MKEATEKKDRDRKEKHLEGCISKLFSEFSECLQSAYINFIFKITISKHIYNINSINCSILLHAGSFQALVWERRNQAETDWWSHWVEETVIRETNTARIGEAECQNDRRYTERDLHRSADGSPRVFGSILICTNATRTCLTTGEQQDTGRK